MIPLTLTTETLQLVLSATADVTVGGFQDGVSPPTFRQVTAGTAATNTICSAIAAVANPKNIAFISVKTIGGANNYTLQTLNSVGSVVTILTQGVLAANETFQYTNGDGYCTLDASGAKKWTLANVTGNLTVDGTLAVTGAVTGGAASFTTGAFSGLVTLSMNAGAVIAASSANSTTSSQAQFQANTFDGRTFQFIQHDSARTATMYGLTLGGYAEIRTSSNTNGILIGTGTLNSDVLIGHSGNIVARFTATGLTLGSTAGVGTTTLTAGAINTSDVLAGVEISEPAAPSANGYKIFAIDSGGGKTILKVRFASGASQTIATEP